MAKFDVTFTIPGGLLVTGNICDATNLSDIENYIESNLEEDGDFISKIMNSISFEIENEELDEEDEGEIKEEAKKE